MTAPDRNVSPILLGISGTLLFFVCVTTGIRLWVRFSLHRFGTDDYLIAGAAFTTIVRFFMQVVESTFGNGRHRWYISESDYQTNNMLGWITQLFLFAGITFLKCSIMFLMLRITDTPMLRRMAYIVMAGLVLTNGEVIIVLLAECKPVSAYWTGNGHCWNSKVRIYSIYCAIGYSIITDIICSLLPVVLMWNLRLPKMTKISVWALTSLGLTATGFGVARAASLGIVTTDLSYVYAITAIWSNLELFIGIIAANLALSRLIYGYFFDNKSQLANASYYNNSHSRFQSSARGSRFRGDTHLDSTPTNNAKRRHPSPTRSDHSDIPLEWGIQKRTDFWVTENGGDSSASTPTNSKIQNNSL